MAFRSGNPVLRKAAQSTEYVDVDYEAATYKGIGIKILYFVLITFIGAMLGMVLLSFAPDIAVTITIFAGIFTFIFAIVGMMVPKASKICGTLYCLIEGMFIGLLSFVFETIVHGVVITALLGTLSVVLVVAVMYITGLVKVTSKFKKFLFMFAISFIIINLMMLLISFIPRFNDIMSFYWIVLIVSAITVLLACLYLFFDMQYIREIVESRQPKGNEWIAAFGISYTILWLYVEILRLVFIIFTSSRNN